MTNDNSLFHAHTQPQVLAGFTFHASLLLSPSLLQVPPKRVSTKAVGESLVPAAENGAGVAFGVAADASAGFAVGLGLAVGLLA